LQRVLPEPKATDGLPEPRRGGRLQRVLPEPKATDGLPEPRRGGRLFGQCRSGKVCPGEVDTADRVIRWWTG